MTGPFDEEAALATDAYIDLLLDRQPTPATAAHPDPLPAQVRATVDLLHAGLPRLHPSFTFEEHLADTLRAATYDRPATVFRLTMRQPRTRASRVDRRMLLGGAALAASGVSMAAVYAWRHGARRGRGARGVTA
jgi:hypothetical protein